MQAIGLNIIVEIVQEQVQLSSGLLLSDQDVANERYGRAKVLSVGTDVPTNKINIGDELYYDKAHGYTMIIDGLPRTIIQYRDVVTIR
jgi:co-chaperonin GroES (HSP10)